MIKDHETVSAAGRERERESISWKWAVYATRQSGCQQQQAEHLFLIASLQLQNIQLSLLVDAQETKHPRQMRPTKSRIDACQFSILDEVSDVR